MNKDIKKIFLILIFYALSGGVYYNFQELWLTDNGLTPQSISTVYSLCALLAVSTIFLCSNLINYKKLKKFFGVLIFLKVLILFALFLLNNSGLNILIKFLIMTDFVVDTEINACIYPLISCIEKNDKIYAVRGLIYSFAYYSGILLATLLLGKTVSALNINFNSYCLLGSILMLVAYFILKTINLEKYYINSDISADNNVFYKIIKKVKNDKITKNYLGFVLCGYASYNSINGLLILILTTNLGFTVSGASNLKLVLGVLAVLIGILILKKLTLKNNYINLSIKFVIRLLLYIIAFLTNNKIIFIITIIFVRLISESYAHVTDAPYINRFKVSEQLAFCNLKEMINYLSRAIGNLFCGIGLALGVKYNFLLAGIFVSFQIFFAFRALYLYNIEKKNGEVI